MRWVIIKYRNMFKYTAIVASTPNIGVDDLPKDWQNWVTTQKWYNPNATYILVYAGADGEYFDVHQLIE